MEQFDEQAAEDFPVSTPLSAVCIAPDLFGVELHGKVHEPGRVKVLVDKATLQAMGKAIQAALNGYAPKPAVEFDIEDLV